MNNLSKSSPKTGRGSGILSGISYHDGQGLLCKRCHDCILHPQFELPAGSLHTNCHMVWVIDFEKAAKSFGAAKTSFSPCSFWLNT